MESVDRLFFNCADHDRLLAGALRIGRGEAPDRAVRRRDAGAVKGRMTAACLFLTCRIAGLGAVWDGSRGTVYGTSVSLDLWGSLSQYRPVQEGVATALECLRIEEEPAGALARRVRRDRVNLLGVQHAVCSDYPQLRLWRHGGRLPGQAEVWLRPAVDDLFLGGVVWETGFYTSGEVFSVLGVNAKRFLTF